MNRYVLDFKHIGKSDLWLVGGKGANLGEMVNAGFPIPNGFCITTTAFDKFFKEHADFVFSRLQDLDGTDLDKIRAVGEEVRTHLKNYNLDTETVLQIQHTWEKFRAGQAYAVRSSATAEDLPTASFAGQQDTYLNVVGLDSLVSRVRDCFVSLFTDRAILYRIQNKFPHSRVAISVVVQKMIFPQVSGIMFTADPVTQNREIISIDASYGLGEALVSGLVNPDLFKIHKSRLRISEKKIEKKFLKIKPISGGGTKQVSIGEPEASAPSISDETALALAELAKQIEKHYQTPQDIEWAIEDGQIFITQSRPITSLYPLPDQKPGEHKVYLSLSHLQVMTDAMPPMAISIWKNIPRFSLDDNGEYAYLKDIGGRLYADVSPVLRHRFAWRALKNMLGVADAQSQSAFLAAKNRPELYIGDKTLSLTGMLAFMSKFLFRVVWSILFTNKTNVVQTANETTDSFIRNIHNELQELGSDGQKSLELAIKRLQEFPKPALTWLPYLAAGLIAQRALRKLVGKKHRYLVEQLERGLEGNVVTEMNLLIGDLADLASDSPAALDWLERVSNGLESEVPKSGTCEASSQFFIGFKAFLDKFGARSGSEIDMSRPRWLEDFTPLAKMILSLTKRHSKGEHRTHYRRLSEKSHQARQQLVEQVPWHKRLFVRRLVKIASEWAPLREHHKFLMVRTLCEVKNVLLDIADNLFQRGQLAKAQHIWFMTIPELNEMIQTPETSMARIAVDRKAEFEINKSKTPPRLLASSGEIIQGKISIAELPEGALAGSPVSAGIFEGVAKVIKDPASETLAPGEILVAPFTDPGWTPLFVNAKALVMEVGGLMTHGSVVAREYGIPAVASVAGAMQQIRTGCRIRVNGDLGYVELLEEDEK